MLSGIFTTYLARFASLVSFVVVLPVVLGSVGPAAYGVYAMTVALGALFQQDLGMGGATTRFVAVAVPKKDYRRIQDVAVASLVFYITTAVAMAAAVAVVFSLTIPAMNDVPPAMEQTAYVLGGLGVMNVFFVLVLSSNRQLLIGVGRLSDVNMLLIGQALLRVALTVLVIALDAGIVAVAVVDLSVTIVLGAAAYVVRRLRLRQVRVSLRRFRMPVLRELFSMSYQLMVIGLASALIMQTGSVIAVLTVSAAAGAVFAAGSRAYQLVKEVTNSLSLAVLPAASMRYAEFGPRHNGELYLRGTMLANMLMLLALVPALAFMDVIMDVWVGGVVGIAAAGVARVLVASMLFNNNHLLALPILTAQGTVSAFSVLHSLWAVSAVVLSAVFGSMWGVVGVATGIVTPIVILELFYVRVTLSQLGLGWRDFLKRCLVRPYLTAAAPAAIVVGLAFWLSPGILGAMWLTAGWLAMAGTAYWFIGIDPATRVQVRQVVRRLFRRSDGEALGSGSPAVDQ